MPDNIPESPAAPTVGAAPLPTPYDGNQASPETFGAGIGTRSEQQAALADQIATKARENADHTALLAAQGSLLTSAGTRMAAFKQEQGVNAVKNAPSVKTAIDDDASRLLEKLQPGRQQTAFRNWWSTTRAGYNSPIEDHAQQQQHVVFDSAAKAKTQALHDQIATNIDTPLARDMAIKDLARTAAATAIRQGQPPEAIAQTAKNAQGDGYAIVLQGLIKQDRGDAAAAFFTPDVQAALGARAADFAHGISIAGAKQEGERKATQIFQLAKVPGSRLPDEAKAFEMLERLPVGAAKDEATARLTGKIARAKDALSQSNAAVFSQAYAAFLAQPAGLRDVNLLPTELRAYITNPANLMTEKAGLLEGLQREDRAHAFNATPTLAQVAQEGLLLAEMARVPQQYAQTSPEQFLSQNAGLLTPAQMRTMQAHHAQIVAANQGAGTIALPPSVEAMLIDVGVKSGGLPSAIIKNPKTVDPKYLGYLAFARDEIRKSEQLWKAKNGKGEMPQAEYLKAINDVWVKGAVPGRFMELTRAEAATAPDTAGRQFTVTDASKVPAKDRSLIEAALRATGQFPVRKPYTPDSIYKGLIDVRVLEEYNKRLRNMQSAKPSPGVTGGGSPLGGQP